MDTELIEIRDTLCEYEPFSYLQEDSQLNDMVRDIEIQYLRKGQVVIAPDERNTALFFIRSGAVESRNKDGKLSHRMQEGEVFGYSSLLRGGRSTLSMMAVEDTLVYCIPSRWFLHYYNEVDAFSDFFELSREARLKAAMASQASDLSLMTCPIHTLLRRPPITAEQHVDILTAANIMSQERVSSLLITADDKLVGVLTDRDLRNRVVAKGLDYHHPVHTIMTPDPITIDAGDYASEAVLKMMSANIHHLPVLRDGQVAGVLSTGDLVQRESNSSVFLISDIHKQYDVAGLQRISKRVPQAFVQLVSADANTQMIGNAMSHIGVAFTRRLLELAEQELGPAPIPYCFLALGSQAREEQTINTDQDNALILHNSYDKAKHGEYFAKLSEFVCKGLDECGYPLCTGEFMAMTPKWRLTLKEWQALFNQWMNEPRAEALLHVSIFFDIRGIYGDLTLAKQLHGYICRQAQQQKGFLSALARNANKRTPPLGFFRQFVLDGEGKQMRTFNLKSRGIAPIIDLVRVHSLGLGSSKLNSFERLADIEAAEILPKGRARDLILALEMIGMVRIRHQAEQLAAGEEPDNKVDPESLSEFERRHLRDAFVIVARQQDFLKYRYPGKGN
ncbi:cyclic nucleotide-binding/CBS domain-containing protein [Maribrevibacterium harenarium]|uniref:Cyclic nucleotide-binding/CBS domain-containing protein n=1 Tax=Maribrevibacterium harenarium TaxID=2589817 RepID=A0A501WWZ0_9GAMM|nr:DUF294 nucleotidyltransferase-like domain-containing protein [Maribrevibacterium harenarium]TPE53988.1 cyclic nucleotide-binding/CBS domain-containing protein [Maribrevibacterium harenarium]